MVLQNAVNTIKERPRDEKKVIAGTVAIVVIVILFLTWAVFFFKKIQNTAPIQFDSDTKEFIQNISNSGSANESVAE